MAKRIPVLIIDDDEITCMLLRRVIRNYTVEIVADAFNAAMKAATLASRTPGPMENNAGHAP